MMDCLYWFLSIPDYLVCWYYGQFKVRHHVDGMRDPVNCAHVFQHLLSNRFDIIALQETHCTNPVLHAWGEQWEGLSEWNCGDPKSSGTAFLFSPSLNVIADRQMDFNGRVLTLSLEVDECKFQILNLYAPNPEMKAE